MKIGFLLFLIVLLGCQPKYEPPDVPIPVEYSERDGMAQQAVDLSEWWKQFEDPQLEVFITEALQDNFDLRIALEKIREMRAEYKIVASKLWPEIDVQASFTRERLSKNTFLAPFEGPLLQDLFLAGFDATWELDFFGKNRFSKQAAFFDYEASKENARGVQVVLLAELAREYMNAVALQEKMGFLKRQIDVREQIFGLTDVKFKAGLSSEINVQQAFSSLELKREQLPPLVSAWKMSLHHIAILLGRPPEGFEEKWSEDRSLPSPEKRVPAVLPSDLLKRRPDIRQAEKQLYATKARIKVAQADLFPTFSLPAFFGYESVQQQTWFKPSSQTWNLIPGFTWPLFAGGRIMANIDVSNSRQRQAALNYENTVLMVLQEIEDNLALYVEEHRRLDLLKGQLSADQRVMMLDDDLFVAGLVDELTALVAQDQELSTEQTLVDSRFALLFDLIWLYKALGGGW